MYLYLRICNLYLYICIWIPPLLLLDPLLLTNLLLPQCASSVNSKHTSTITIIIMFQLFNIAFNFYNCAGGLPGLLVQLSDLIYMILGCIMRRERETGGLISSTVTRPVEEVGARLTQMSGDFPGSSHHTLPCAIRAWLSRENEIVWTSLGWGWGAGKEELF